MALRNMIPEGKRGVAMTGSEEDWGAIMGTLKPQAFVSQAFLDESMEPHQFVEALREFKTESSNVELSTKLIASWGGAGSLKADVTFDSPQSSDEPPNIEGMAEPPPPPDSAGLDEPSGSSNPLRPLRPPDRGGDDPTSGALGGDERATHTQAHPAQSGSALAADRDPDPTDGYHLATTARWSNLGHFMERHGRSYDRTFNRHIRFDPIAASHDTTARLARVNYTNAIKWDNFNRYDRVKSNKLYPLI